MTSRARGPAWLGLSHPWLPLEQNREGESKRGERGRERWWRNRVRRVGRAGLRATALIGGSGGGMAGEGCGDARGKRDGSGFGDERHAVTKGMQGAREGRAIGGAGQSKGQWRR